MSLAPAVLASMTAISEAEDRSGIDTAKFKRCVRKVAAKQKGTSKIAAKNAGYAICTATFQKAGLFQPGTADLTSKGVNATKESIDEAKAGGPAKKLQNALMGMSGGLVGAKKALADLRPQMIKTNEGTVEYEKLEMDLIHLDQTLALLKQGASHLT
jgi:hypothetical protein